MGKKIDRKTKSRAQNSKPKTTIASHYELSHSMYNTQAWKHSVHRAICTEISLHISDLLVCLRCKHCGVRKQQDFRRAWRSNAWDSSTKAVTALVLADCSMTVLAPEEDMIPHSNPASRGHRRQLETPQWISRFFRHQAPLYLLTFLISTPTSDALLHISSSIVSTAARYTHLPQEAEGTKGNSMGALTKHQGFQHSAFKLLGLMIKAPLHTHKGTQADIGRGKAK